MARSLEAAYLTQVATGWTEGQRAHLQWSGPLECRRPGAAAARSAKLSSSAARDECLSSRAALRPVSSLARLGSLPAKDTAARSATAETKAERRAKLRALLAPGDDTEVKSVLVRISKCAYEAANPPQPTTREHNRSRGGELDFGHQEDASGTTELVRRRSSHAADAPPERGPGVRSCSCCPTIRRGFWWLWSHISVGTLSPSMLSCALRAADHGDRSR